MSIEAATLHHVMGEASESEIAAGYVNARDAVETRITMMEMGYPQPSAPLEMDPNNYYQDDQRRWICGSISWETVKIDSSLISIGAKETEI